MRQVREILRMKHEAGLPVREIVRRTGIPRRTVRELLERCAWSPTVLKSKRLWDRCWLRGAICEVKSAPSTSN